MCSSRWTTNSKGAASGAALFVSMHADALSDHAVRGASVYTLANTASDAQTAALATRKQRGSIRRVRLAQHPSGGAAYPGQPDSAGNANRFRRLSRSLVGSFDQDLPMLPIPERHAGFVVLKAVDIPSVLVEMGFMSNRNDEAELRRPEHRARVAEAMKRAVDGYFAAVARIATLIA